ncbi:MAG: D-glycero-beta-D-manno-heptose-7-phosphate kinase [Thermodesulfovibrionales bacterium]
MDYKRILSQFKNKRVLVIGDIILDHYIWGSVDRISPEAPVPVVTVTRENYLLGGAGNVASNVVSLGAKATIAGLVGEDHRGSMVREMLEDRGISAEGLVTAPRTTTVKTRVIAQSQQVVRVDREDSSEADKLFLEKFSAFVRERIASFDAVIVSDYRKGVISGDLIRAINRHAKPRGILVAVDPKVGNFRFYRGVSLITPNKKEASEGAGIPITDETSLVRAGRKLLSGLRCETVLVTRGEEGMSLIGRDFVDHVPAVARHVFDVTGAGDTVISTFSLALTAGAPLREAAVIANHAAGIVVGELGTATASAQEILKSIRSPRPWQKQ